jgi:subtilisin family serine protease
MEWVLQNAILPAVVNMSVGGDSDPLINEAVQSLTERGITVVVAAGNTALDACLGSPSSAPSAITVGATDQTDTRAPFSSWGSCVDIFAPGAGITSAWKDGGSLTISGTSMATPHVSGVVALYLGEHPQGLPSEVSDSINAYSTKGVVKNASSAAWNLLYSGTTVGGGESTAPLPSLPSAPTNLSISVTKMVNGDVTEYLETFRWSVPSGEIALYVIEGTSGDKSDSFTVPGDRDHGFRQLPEGTWTFHMKAYNMAGYSAWSNSASVCVPGPNTLCDPVIPPDTVTPPDTTAPPVPCRKRGRSGKCK